MQNEDEERGDRRPAERRSRFVHRRRDREGRRLRAVRADVRYGQRHVRELEAARAWRRRSASKRHLELAVDLRAHRRVGAHVDDRRAEGSRDLTASDIPSTYVPARNTVFCRWRSAWAEVLGAPTSCIGVNALDYSGYPDCRPEYHAGVRAAGRAGDARPASKARRFRVHAPLLAHDEGRDHRRRASSSASTTA